MGSARYGRPFSTLLSRFLPAPAGPADLRRETRDTSGFALSGATWPGKRPPSRHRQLPGDRWHSARTGLVSHFGL